LPRQGITVELFEQPWRVRGGRVASPPPTLDDGLTAAARALRARSPLVVGGRSAGARSAARTARALGAAGCLALAFPLHPPGRPERSRLDELLGSGVPTLVVQGENDTFGRPDEFPSDTDLAVVPAADHGFATPKRSGVTEEDAMAVVVESALEWIVREVAGNP
jgi:predicted alpha/beta-hydrolase family hydrolase